MKKNKNLNEQETGADTKVSDPSPAAEIDKWFLYEEGESSLTDEEKKIYQTLKDAVIEYDKETLPQFIFSNPESLDNLKIGIAERATRGTHDVKGLVEKEIKEIEQMFNLDTNQKWGEWWSVLKWTFDQVNSHSEMTMEYVRTRSSFEGILTSVMQTKTPLKYVPVNFPFLSSPPISLSYKAYWLESFYYLSAGGNYAWYLVYLKENRSNPDVIKSFVPPVLKLPMKGQTNQIYHIFWQLLRTHEIIKTTQENLARFMADHIEWVDGHNPSYTTILRKIEKTKEADIQPMKGRRYKIVKQ